MPSEQLTIATAGRPLSAGAVALMLMLCLSWGFNQVAVKLALPDIPPILQATIRSAGALIVLMLIARLRGVKMFERDGTLVAGLFAGLIFGVEFVLIYRGLFLTSASRAAVFLYTAPFFVAFGSYIFLDERLRASQTMALIKAPAEKGLGYQVAVSIPILGFAAWIFGETLTRVPGPLALTLMVYQSIWVVGLTFLIWFALVKTYSASKLSAFTFITPLFGVVASYLILHDNLTPAFGAAALLVIAGLYLVNRPGPAVPAATDPLLNVTKT